MGKFGRKIKKAIGKVGDAIEGKVEDALTEPETPYIETCGFHQGVDKSCQVVYELDGYAPDAIVPLRAIAWGRGEFDIIDAVTGALIRKQTGEFLPVFITYNQSASAPSATLRIPPPLLLPAPYFQPIPGKESCTLVAVEYIGAVIIDEAGAVAAVGVYDGASPQVPVEL